MAEQVVSETETGSPIGSVAIFHGAIAKSTGKARHSEFADALGIYERLDALIGERRDRIADMAPVIFSGAE